MYGQGGASSELSNDGSNVQSKTRCSDENVGRVCKGQLIGEERGHGRGACLDLMYETLRIQRSQSRSRCLDFPLNLFESTQLYSNCPHDHLLQYLPHSLYLTVFSLSWFSYRPDLCLILLVPRALLLFFLFFFIFFPHRPLSLRIPIDASVPFRSELVVLLPIPRSFISWSVCFSRLSRNRDRGHGYMDKENNLSSLTHALQSVVPPPPPSPFLIVFSSFFFPSPLLYLP